jgi:BirA family biotin operon repressor/biotin-[acetyl-CoA-carboxylase] ligase
MSDLHQTGFIRHCFESVDSTNTIAKLLIARGAVHGTLVTAEHQTAGRGRFDRQWLSKHSDNILVSFILRPSVDVARWGVLPLAIGTAVCKAVHAYGCKNAGLKWPNDLIVGNRKLAGILVESGGFESSPWAVVGVGINVNQIEFAGDYRHVPTSMALETGLSVDRALLLNTLCNEMDQILLTWRNHGNIEVVNEWKKHSAMLGRRVKVGDGELTIVAEAVDIDEDGSLVVQTSDGRRSPVYAGDVTIMLEDWM